MASQYFSNFPKVIYEGQNINNIALRVAFVMNAVNNQQNYYPYTIKEGESAEQIAFFYYGDSNYVWVIYLFNLIFDPYYQWPLNYDQFVSYIVDKYGSLEIAMSTPLYYEHQASQYYVSTDGKQIVPSGIYNVHDYGSNFKLITGNDYYTIPYSENINEPLLTLVSAYDDEWANNENKRFIKLLDKSFVSQVSTQLGTLLNG